MLPRGWHAGVGRRPTALAAGQEGGLDRPEDPQSVSSNGLPPWPDLLDDLPICSKSSRRDRQWTKARGRAFGYYGDREYGGERGF